MLEKLWLHAGLSSEGKQCREEGCWGGEDTEREDILTNLVLAARRRGTAQGARTLLYCGAEMGCGMVGANLHKV